MAEEGEELHILVVGVLVLFGTVTISHPSSSVLDDKKLRLVHSSLSKQFLGSGIDMINDRINDLINDMRSGLEKPTPD